MAADSDDLVDRARQLRQQMAAMDDDDDDAIPLGGTPAAPNNHLSSPATRLTSPHAFPSATLTPGSDEISLDKSPKTDLRSPNTMLNSPMLGFSDVETPAMEQEQAPDVLRNAISRNDIDGVKEYCRDTPIPAHQRAEVWQVLLGVTKKGDPMRDWLSPGGASEEMKQEVRLQRLDAYLASQLEDVLIFYCQTRSVPYVSGLAALGAPFARLGMSRGEICVCLYSVVAKFVPQITAGERMSEVALSWFRLLLKYHDPLLSAHLDRVGLTPSLYANPWLRHLGSMNAQGSVLEGLWDAYLIDGDPVLNFFVCLAFLIRNRELLLASQNSSLPIEFTICQVASVTELEQLLRHARELDRSTPKSFRQQLLSGVFNPKKAATPTEMPPCLTVTLAEVVFQSNAASQDTGSVKYFLVDTRPERDFRSGHLPTAFHAQDADNLVTYVASFETMKGDHMCLFNSGKTEDEPQLLDLIDHFTSRGFAHVSIAKGGYRTAHSLLASRTMELAEHTPARCCECVDAERERTKNQPPPPESKAAQISAKASEVKSEIGAKFKAFSVFMKKTATEVKEKVQETTKRDRKDSAGASAASSDQGGNSSAAFSLDDEGDSTEPSTAAPPLPDPLIPASSKIQAIPIGTCIVVESWMSAPDIFFFQCQWSESLSAKAVPRYLVVSDYFIMTLEAHRERMGEAIVRSQYFSERLQKVTFKKSAPNLLKLGFQPTIPRGEGDLDWRTAQVQDPQAVLNAVQGASNRRREQRSAGRRGDAEETNGAATVSDDT